MASQAATTASAGLITRRFGRTDLRVPAIGLGTFMTFDRLPGAAREPLFRVVQRFWQAGGRVFDTSPLYGSSEVTLGDAASRLGINGQMFVANKIWSTGDHLADASHAEHSLKRSLERLWLDRLDLVQCHNLVNVDVIVPLLQAWKQEGLIGAVGITHHEPAYYPILTQWLERGLIDVVQIRYSIHTRAAEERLLEVAADRGVAVLVNMPLEKARLHRLVAGRPLPDFAKELEIASWAEFFLKWVISQPSVTCALPATSNPEHELENVRAMRGPLPDAALRARMLGHLQALPGFAELDRGGPASWYPGKSYRGLVARSQQVLRGSPAR